MSNPNKQMKPDRKDQRPPPKSEDEKRRSVKDNNPGMVMK